MATEKTCARCHEVKDLDEFHTRSQGGKPHSYCKTCLLAYYRVYRENYHVRARWLRLRLVIPGLTLDEVNAFFARFQGVCEICGDAVSGRNLHLDHNDTTKTLRGWLCGNCNRALGLFSHEPDRLHQAISYLLR